MSRFRRRLSREDDLIEAVEVAVDALEAEALRPETRVQLALGVLRRVLRRLWVERRDEKSSVER